LKKEPKTFANWRVLDQQPTVIGKSFCFFFQKEALSLTILSSMPDPKYKRTGVGCYFLILRSA
jgi:hypothetical protein